METKNSNFARGNTVSHLTYIGDSDVGKYCNFGCGTVTCNYDGKDKFRTQIGDYCFIGCNILVFCIAHFQIERCAIQNTRLSLRRCD